MRLCWKRLLLFYAHFRNLVIAHQSSPSSSSTNIPISGGKYQPHNSGNGNKMRLLASKKQSNHMLGQIYTNREAATAFRKKKLNSKLNASIQRIRLVFLNETDEPLILCWVHENGNLHHYYKLKPCGSPVLTSLDRHELEMKNFNAHLENTFLGHAFVLGTCCDGTMEDVEQTNIRGGGGGGGAGTGRDGDKKRRMGDIIAGYRPLKVSLSHVEDAGLCVHIIRIQERAKSASMTMLCDKRRYDLIVEQYEMDNTPLDTTKKVYDEMILGGWKCMCEHGLFDEKKDNPDDSSVVRKVKKQLELDLEACSRKLPSKACKLLQESVPFWINKSQKYGPKCAPIEGKGMCFHVHPSWLSRNGMSTQKCGGVEIYQAEKYLDSHGLWYGTGGGLLHELSHAWHNKFAPDGYCNKDIIECYEAAMKDKLYDCVKVHNRRGGTDKCRAYAATNAEEYFAELSVAFLGGVGDDEDLEFNKWYPFNRKQLKVHDPRAYKMLHKVWGVEDGSKRFMDDCV